jgi:hypothetical protein
VSKKRSASWSARNGLQAGDTHSLPFPRRREVLGLRRLPIVSDKLSRSVFTIEVDRRPVLMFSTRFYADAQAICTDDRMRQKLSSVSSGGKPLCDDIAIVRVRLARPEEKVKYLEETATRAHETGLVVVYLVKLDRAPAY